MEKDIIDVKLGDYINVKVPRPRPKRMFIREKEGLYKFGQSKVIINMKKTDKDSLHVLINGQSMPLQ